VVVVTVVWGIVESVCVLLRKPRPICSLVEDVVGTLVVVVVVVGLSVAVVVVWMVDVVWCGCLWRVVVVGTSPAGAYARCPRAWRRLRGVCMCAGAGGDCRVSARLAGQRAPQQ
jgi:hypothetical protein